jgi:uncharacterized cupin superfamily protein
MAHVIAFTGQQTAPDVDHPAPERRVRGNPARTTWNHYTNDSGEVFSGVWSSEAGSWRIFMGPTEDEFFFVVSGRCRLVDETGHAVEAGPGESLLIPAGFTGTFDVLEPMVKHYMIVDRRR